MITHKTMERRNLGSCTGFFYEIDSSTRGEPLQFVSIASNSKPDRLPNPFPGFLELKWKNSRDLKIVDSCKGLVLCHDKKTTYVCNPLTKEKLVLPKDPLKTSKRTLYALAAELNKDSDLVEFRVIAVCTPKNRSNLWIFSSKTGEWNKIDGKLPQLSHDCVNGSKVLIERSLYWDCLEGYILGCHLDLAERRVPTTGYSLIEAPRAPLWRSLWESEDRKLHCYCHGCADKFPAWILCYDEEKITFEWKEEGSEEFRSLSEDVSRLVTEDWLSQTESRPLVGFKVVSYVPEFNAVLLHMRDRVYEYKLREKELTLLARPADNWKQPRKTSVTPYIHSPVPMEKPHIKI